MVEWDSLRILSLTVCAVIQTLFVMFYLTFGWYRSFLGRALFGKAVALMLIVDFAALSRWFDFGTDDKVFTLLYTALTLGVLAQFVAFIKVRAEGRQDVVSRNPEAQP